MQSINRSECPRELEPTDRNIPVNVNLVKRITEDWQVSSYGHCGDVMDSGCVMHLKAKHSVILTLGGCVLLMLRVAGTS